HAAAAVPGHGSGFAGSAGGRCLQRPAAPPVPGRWRHEPARPTASAGAALGPGRRRRRAVDRQHRRTRGAALRPGHRQALPAADRRMSREGTTPAPGFDGKAFVRDLTLAPGVYRMLAADGSVLYVGKAASLRKRVASYFLKEQPSRRIALMVAQIAGIEVTITRTESEALILENQLIKSLRPRYNVLLRDDKSYPHIVLTDETWPRLAYQRGPRSVPGRYFGPFTSSAAVRETLDLMFKLFKLRSCEDSIFRNRSRPCLQHQIGRCSAPCVGLVPTREYDAIVRRAALFLEGRSTELVDEMGQAMESASGRLEFEQAAQLRDQIAAIRRVQARQYVEGEQVEMDVLACVMEQGTACVLLMRSEEHTSELQSRENLVCRLLLEKKKKR